MPTVLRSRNLALDTAAVERVRHDLGPLVRRTRQERRLLHEQWLRYDNILKVRHDSESYHGRHKAYLAIGRRVIENWVTKLKNDLFPDSGKWFQVKPESRDSEEGVAVLEALFRRFLWDHMRVRRKAGPILRQLVTLGTSPVDIGWRYAEREVPTLQRIYDEASGNMGRATEVIKRVVEYIGPVCRPVDLFRFYVYPTTVNDIDDLGLLFEDIILTQNDIERLGRTLIDPRHPDLGHQFENVEKAVAIITGGSKGDTLEKFHAERRRLIARGLRSPVDTHEDPNQLLICTKSYWRTALEPMETDEVKNTPEVPRWYQVVTAGDEDIVLQCRPVVFWTGNPSYLVPKFIEVWEEFYGYGLPSTFDSLAYLTNDVLNQGADALTFAINPIVAVDPGAVQDLTTVRMRPGAKWLVRRPQDNVHFFEPSKESAAAAMSSIQQLIALISDAANIAPFGGGGMLGARSRGRALQTASGMAQVASENLVQLHDIVQSVEDLWLDPMLRKMHQYTMQCLDVPILLNVVGAAGAATIQRQVTRDDLIGEFSFRWLASTANYNMQVRGQQMIGFFQQIARMPPELLAQENARISLKFLLRSIWSEGLQLPEAERLIEDVQPVRALDAELENQLYLASRADEVRISPADDDMRHLRVHDALLGPASGLRPEVTQQVIQHMQEHMTGMLTKRLMQMQQAQGGGRGGLGAMPGRGGLLPPQNPGRMAQTASPDDLARTMDRQPDLEGAGGGPFPQ